MPREITLDIETADSFADVGKYDPTLLHVSLVGVYDSATGEYSHYLCDYARDERGNWVKDAEARMTLTRDGLADLWKLLQSADRVIGYNILNFDYGVLDRYYPGGIYQSLKERKAQQPRFETVDLLVEIEKSLGFRVKLDDVALATLGIGKTGHGLQAIEFFKKGEIDKLRDYCLNDVKVTWEVYKYGLEHGHVKYKDRTGQLKEVPIDFRQKEKKPVAQTLF